jgi:ArpU family phage transcriptional regulator
VVVLDKVEVAERVRKFLSNEFQTHLRRAQIANILPGSPTLSDDPRGGGYGNAQENKLVEYLYSKQIVESFYIVIELLPLDWKRILEMCYIDNLNDIVVMDRIGVARSTFYEYKQRALLEFAELFQWIVDFKF